jgi:hypothetical protein
MGRNAFNRIPVSGSRTYSHRVRMPYVDRNVSTASTDSGRTPKDPVLFSPGRKNLTLIRISGAEVAAVMDTLVDSRNRSSVEMSENNVIVRQWPASCQYEMFIYNNSTFTEIQLGSPPFMVSPLRYLPFGISPSVSPLRYLPLRVSPPSVSPHRYLPFGYPPLRKAP